MFKFNLTLYIAPNNAGSKGDEIIGVNVSINGNGIQEIYLS